MRLSERTRRIAAAVVAAIALLIAAFAWWFDARTRSDHVGPRFAEGLKSRHPGTTVERFDGGVLHVVLPSGNAVDVRLSDLFDRCRSSRLDCSEAIDHALDDVDHAEAATRAPERSMLRPVVAGDGAGYRYGYITDPLVASFEVRYALASGLAATFVTPAIADQLHLSRDALRSAALDGSRTEDAQLERVPDVDPPVYRVRSTGDPAAALLDHGRMERFATSLGARRLYAIIPTRDTLALAAASDASARALDALRVRLRGNDARTLDGGLLSYDADAVEGQALTIATRSSALPPP
jgi:hypothetical protein